MALSAHDEVVASDDACPVTLEKGPPERTVIMVVAWVTEFRAYIATSIPVMM